MVETFEFERKVGTFSLGAESKKTELFLQELQAIPFLSTGLLKSSPMEDVCAVFCLPFLFSF